MLKSIVFLQVHVIIVTYHFIKKGLIVFLYHNNNAFIKKRTQLWKSLTIQSKPTQITSYKQHYSTYILTRDSDSRVIEEKPASQDKHSP